MGAALAEIMDEMVVACFSQKTNELILQNKIKL